MKMREMLGLGVFFLAGAFAGCGSSDGGREGATDDQKRDPVWVQAQLKAMDKDPTIPTTKASKR